MNQLVLKIVILFVLLSQINFSYSQKIRGTYLTVHKPADAPRSNRTGDGALEFPVKSTKSEIKLKLFHRLVWIETNLDDSNPQVSKGKWKTSGKTISLSLQTPDGLVLLTYEMLKLKSGVYFKPVNDYFHYYKKQ